MNVNSLKNGDKPEVAVVVEEVLTPQLGINEPSALEMALIDDAIASDRARDKYYGSLGWLGKRKQWSYCTLATVFDCVVKLFAQPLNTI